MSKELEQQIREVASRRFAIPPTEPIPPQVRETILRTSVFNTGKPILSEGGGSIADKLDRWRRSEKRAEEHLRQREAIDNPQPEPSAKQLRIELLESRLRQEGRADPGRRAHLQRELEQAKAELGAEKLEQEKTAVETARREYLESDEHYLRALEHAQSTSRLLERGEDEDEHFESVVRLKQLEQATPENSESVLKDYWQGVAKMDDRTTLKEQAKAVEANRIAADAVGRATDAQTKVLESKHRADSARINSQQEN